MPIGIQYAALVLVVDEADTMPKARMTPRIMTFWYEVTANPWRSPADVSERYMV